MTGQDKAYSFLKGIISRTKSITPSVQVKSSSYKVPKTDMKFPHDREDNLIKTLNSNRLDKLSISDRAKYYKMTQSALSRIEAKMEGEENKKWEGKTVNQAKLDYLDKQHSRLWHLLGAIDNSHTGMNTFDKSKYYTN